MAAKAATFIPLPALPCFSPALPTPPLPLLLPAAYGFLGDVTSAAERYRWLGPLRYDLVGAVKLLARWAAAGNGWRSCWIWNCGCQPWMVASA
jgi:hypothetical protein